ncbi:MAG: type II TA system antitoxin MqsA family protein [bacterium]
MGMKKICTACGNRSLVHKKGTFHFEVDDRATNPDAREFHINIRNADWDECEVCGEQILSEELDGALGKWQYTREGLLTPEAIRNIRLRHKLTQKQISEILGVGEKSYTRWENGLSMQTKAMDNLIRIFDMSPKLFAKVESERESALA